MIASLIGRSSRSTTTFSVSTPHRQALEHRLPSVGGRINEEDIAAVRDRARIEEIVGSYVTLRSAGGTMKGLCPFHDEKTPSFQVTPSRGYWYCFGACAEGGDVIDFMRKIDNLSFVEAVERLADRVGIQLRYTDDAGAAARAWCTNPHGGGASAGGGVLRRAAGQPGRRRSSAVS